MQAIFVLTEAFKRWWGSRRFRDLGFRTVTYALPDEGEVCYAEWLHTASENPVITQAQVDFFKRFIRPGALAIDIGAHEGDTTVPMALAAGPGGMVLGIEPNPYVFKVLAVNATFNRDKTNIVPLHFAAATDDAEYVYGSGDPCFLNGGLVGFSSNRPSNNRWTFKVRGCNLGRFLDERYAGWLSRLAFIKIDVEGYDKEILKNLSGIIERYRPVVVAECFGELNAAERADLFDGLAKHDYRIFRLSEFQLGRRDAMSPEDMLSWRHFDILGIPVEIAPGPASPGQLGED